MVIAITITLTLFSENVQSQTVVKENPMSELILGIPKASEKNFSLVTDAIFQVKGIELVQFCPVHQLALIKYDKNTFATKEDVVRALQAKNLSMPMFIKEGSFEDVKDMCNE